MIGRHDFADATTLHDLAKADALSVAGYRTYAAAHIGIDGEPLRFDKDLTGPRVGHGLHSIVQFSCVGLPCG